VSLILNILPIDFWLTLTMQEVGNWMTPVMEFFSWLGYPQAYMIMIAVIYWSVDRNLGIRLAIFLPFTASLNSILKQALHAPRPFWLDPEIKAIWVSNGFGMPSGHAQAATVWLYAASFFKRRWFWIGAAFIVFMIGASRVYLGVHFPTQIFIGWVIGIGIVVLFIRREKAFLNWFLGLKLINQVLVITGTTLSIIILGGIFVFMHRNWQMPSDWLLQSADDFAGRDETILHSQGMGAVAGNAGGFFGASLGALFSYLMGGFDSRGSGWTKILRSLIGLLILSVLYGVFDRFSPEQSMDWLISIWRFGGYFAISFSALFLVPIILMRMKLLTPMKKA
jgi:membrane-associated phospholipid phosphatase